MTRQASAAELRVFLPVPYPRLVVSLSGYQAGQGIRMEQLSACNRHYRAIRSDASSESQALCVVYDLQAWEGCYVLERIKAVVCEPVLQNPHEPSLTQNGILGRWRMKTTQGRLKRRSEWYKKHKERLFPESRKQTSETAA